MSEFQEVLYSVSDGVAVVSLNRPDRMNAMTLVMAGEIRAAMQKASDDPAVKVVVLTGEGRGFCAGADSARLGARAAGGEQQEVEPYPVNGPIEGGLDLPEGYAAKYACITTVPKPVIGAINGAAAGVGLVLAAFCDVRFAADTAKFVSAFARRGLISEYGLAWLLPRLVGASRTLDILLSSRTVEAAEAERIGLVDRVCPADQLMATVMDYARAMAAEVSPRSTRVIKQLVYRSLDQSISDALEENLAEMAQAMESDDFREGIAAWRDKRAPAFTGQ